MLGGDMCDIQDSPAWTNFHFRTPYHLAFGLYVDWFNPLYNKIAGAKISCGVIVLYCLNLPLHLYYKPENNFIIGIMPPLNLPKPTTISHLLEPVIEAILAYCAPGKYILPPQLTCKLLIVWIHFL